MTVIGLNTSAASHRIEFSDAFSLGPPSLDDPSQILFLTLGSL
jgi:hypothetical protein